MVKPDLRVNIAGIELKNPVLAASGTFGYGTEYEGFVNADRFGALVAKGLTLEPCEGNPPPRIVETPCGMINAIGLHNVGVERFLEEKLPALKKTGVPVIANIGGGPGQMMRSVEMLNGSGVSGIELNLSCPNLKGAVISRSPVSARNAVVRARRLTRLPLIAKLSPMVSDISRIALACEEGGADAISLINTIPAAVIDITGRRPFLGNFSGGLSGPAIKPVALKLVWDVCRAVKISVIGMGGIMTGGDALEFMIAGAGAVAIGTATFADPLSIEKIIREMEGYLEEHGFRSVSEIIGTVKCPHPKG